MPLDLLNQNGVGRLKVSEVRGYDPSNQGAGKNSGQQKMSTFYPYLSCNHNTQGILVPFFRKKRSILAIDGTKTYPLAQRPT
jgi:hypothetical protein